MRKEGRVHYKNAIYSLHARTFHLEIRIQPTFFPLFSFFLSFPFLLSFRIPSFLLSFLFFHSFLSFLPFFLSSTVEFISSFFRPLSCSTNLSPRFATSFSSLSPSYSFSLSLTLSLSYSLSLLSLSLSYSLSYSLSLSLYSLTLSLSLSLSYSLSSILNSLDSLSVEIRHLSDLQVLASSDSLIIFKCIEVLFLVIHSLSQRERVRERESELSLPLFCSQFENHRQQDLQEKFSCNCKWEEKLFVCIFIVRKLEMNEWFKLYQREREREK